MGLEKKNILNGPRQKILMNYMKQTYLTLARKDNINLDWIVSAEPCKESIKGGKTNLR